MKQMNIISIIALVLIFLGGVGAILLTIGQTISSSEDKNDIINTTKEENKYLKKELSEIRKERDELNKTLEIRDSNIQEQNSKIIQLSSKVSEKSDYIQNYITGGTGYLFLDMRKLSSPGQYNTFMFQLDNFFDLPLYNINCNIYDYEIIKNKSYYRSNTLRPYIKLNDYKGAKIVDTEFSEINAHNFITIDQIFPVKNSLFYAVIRARNQTVIAKMTILIVGQGDYFGLQIFDKKGKLLKEDINNEMPKAISDQVKIRLESIPSNMSLNLEEN